MQAGLFSPNQPPSRITLRPMRPRQISALTQVKDAIRAGHKRIILQAPTGWGKTLWSAHIISAAIAKGTKPLFTAPAISLIDQTVAAFEREGIHDIGVMQAQHERTNHAATVQIASVQTLIRRAAPEIGFALVDECHETWDKFDALLDSPAWKDKVVIGLSATPWAKGMGLRWTKLVIAGTINDMIAEGHACPAIVYGPEKDVDRDALAVERGEFVDKSAGEAMSTSSIIGDVLKEWRDKSPREKTFAFCVNRDHARAQMEAFQDCGIPFGYIDALVEPADRQRIFHQMNYGEIAGICSVGCLIRGVDQDVRCILDLQPTKSEMRHVQKWGRGVRMADGKTHLLGLDHAGNNASLGLFTDIYHDTLDDRKPGERGEAYKDDAKPAKPRKCSKCHNIVPPGARACPTCSERMPLYPGVTVKDGRLVEVVSYSPKAQSDFARVQSFLESKGLQYLREFGWQNGYEIAVKHGYRGPKPEVAEPKKQKPFVDKVQQQWFSELLSVARKAGYKDGWAAFKFQERFGVMPKGLKKRGKTETSPEVKEFVKVQRKQYLASKQGTIPNMEAR